MEFSDLILSRKSVRNYDPDRPVPKAILEKILEAGRLAPSAHNCQPWKFLIISSKPLLDKVKACYQREWIKDAPHILVATGFRDQAWVRGYDGYNSIETDVTIAMTHIILAAENEGVKTCWIAAYNPALLKDVLPLKKEQVLFGMTPLGYTKPDYIKTAEKSRKSLKEIVEFF